MAEKRKMPGERKSTSVGKALLSPTRSSPRNKANSSEISAAEVTKEAPKSKRTLIDHFKAMPRATKKQEIEEVQASVTDNPSVPEKDAEKGVAPVKKRGRKPGPKKGNDEATAGKAGSKEDERNTIEVTGGGKKSQKSNSEVNGVYENIIWVKCENSRNARVSGKKAGKDADSSLEEVSAESAAGPNLTYPGDLKCDSCQRTFSNSSGFKRHLKFCMDAEGPPVIMKIKKAGTSPLMNGATGIGSGGKKVNSIEKYMSKARGTSEVGKNVGGGEEEGALKRKATGGRVAVGGTQGRLDTFGFVDPKRKGRVGEGGGGVVPRRGGGRKAKAATATAAAAAAAAAAGEEEEEDDPDDFGESDESEGDEGLTLSDLENMEDEDGELSDGGGQGTEKSLREKMKGVTRVSFEQREVMLDFMIQHHELAYNKLVGPLGGQRKEKLWQELSEKLNSCSSRATKDVGKWAKLQQGSAGVEVVEDVTLCSEDTSSNEAEATPVPSPPPRKRRCLEKDVMLVKVNELIDETSATAPGKCHCCGEDLETAHSGGEFECDDCGKHFKLRASLDRHRRVIHLQGETHACPECDARCPDKGSLARHMYTHTGLKPYSCVRCKKQFSRKYHLERHIVQTGCDGNPKPTYPCQVCGRMFSRKDNLREHLRAHAGQVKRKKKYSCEYCLKEFHGTSLLRIHVRTHTGERPFVCDFCQKGFPSSGAMKKHRRMHTGERPYECKDCFAKFSAKETLNRHARTHTGLKPHVCNYCGKSFIQASQLRAHVFHHTGENGFTCDHCGKAFNRRARLHMHVKYVHEGARPFECTNCGKTFVRKEDLVRHTVLHSGVKAHKCPICEKSFAMKSSLKIHLLTHTKEPPRSCDECGRAFIRQDCLLRHMRSKHREMLEEILAEAEKKKLQQQLLAATAMASRIVVRGERSRVTHLGDEDMEEEDEDEMDDVPEAGAIDRVLGMSGSDSAKAGALLQHLTAMGETAGANPMPRMEASASSSNTRLSSNHHQGGSLSETALADSVRELLTLLVDDATLRAFGWPDAPVDKLLEAVIRRCGHQPASPEDYSRPSDRLRENAKLLFTVVIDDSAVKTLLNNQTVDEVILHVLRLAKS